MRTALFILIVALIGGYFLTARQSFDPRIVPNFSQSSWIFTGEKNLVNHGANGVVYTWGKKRYYTFGSNNNIEGTEYYAFSETEPFFKEWGSPHHKFFSVYVEELEKWASPFIPLEVRAAAILQQGNMIGVLFVIDLGEDHPLITIPIPKDKRQPIPEEIET